MVLFTPDDTAILLIDHQLGTMSWIGSADLDESRPTRSRWPRARWRWTCRILITSLEDHAQGPLLPELAEIAPKQFKERIQRTGVVDAMDDPAFAAAVKATGRPNLIIVGVTNDVCTVYRTLTALQQGIPRPGHRRRRWIDDQAGRRHRAATHGEGRRRDRLDEPDPHAAGPQLVLAGRSEAPAHRRRLQRVRLSAARPLSQPDVRYAVAPDRPQMDGRVAGLGCPDELVYAKCVIREGSSTHFRSDGSARRNAEFIR
jgi:hypothetical protein